MDNASVRAGSRHGSDGWRNLTLYGLLVRAAGRWPNRLALVSKDQRIRYRSLLDRVDRMAAALINSGVQATDRVATFFGPNIEWVILSYAVNRLGALLIPLNIRFQAQELHDVLKDFEITVLATMDRYGRYDLLSRVIQACPELEAAKNGWVASATLPNLCLVSTFSPEQRRFEYTQDFSALYGLEADLNDLHEKSFPAIHPDDPAVVILTSGSSGRPKGVLLSHNNLIGHAHYLSRILEIGPGDRYLNLLPFYHIAGYAQSVLMNHYAGSALVLPASFAPEDVLAAVERNKVTAWAGMPVTVRRALDCAAREGVELSPIIKMHGASPDLIDRVRRETNVEILTRMYGLTESAGLVSMIRIQEGNADNIPTCVGVPLPGVDVQIVNPESGQRLQTGDIGEILFKGWNRFKGYLNPERQAGGIDRDGYFHTGDRGYLDAENCLHFLGRFKEIIKSGGENVSQVEVERFLMDNIEGIKAVFVIGIPDASWGEAVTAIIEPEDGVELAPGVVNSACSEGLASFKRPKHILWMPSGGWPQSGTGKVDIQALKKWACRELSIDVPVGP
ncbi:MAG: acyl--CoA ligase [Anaerolineales bacterium]|nr:acyl--CoA ligase [Anaerolineales bacterium]